MTPDEIAVSLGIDLNDYQPPGSLAPAAQLGSALHTSGHVSRSYKGKLGADLDVEQGRSAARECAVQLLQAVFRVNGTLNNLRCVKVLGAVNSTPDFTDQHLVINGASELIWEVFGKETRGYHARSALGFASLPTGVAVEVEAIFEIVEDSTPVASMSTVSAASMSNVEAVYEVVEER
jgi:enamine deaminase RidA (YjgF/YER057c/UK114 family)